MKGKEKGSVTKGRLTRREEVEPRFRWELSELFPTVREWEGACADFEGRLEELEAQRGRLATGPQALLSLLRLREEMGIAFHRIWFWSLLTFDEHRRDNAREARYQMAKGLFLREIQVSSWFRPELVAVGRERVEEWLETNEELGLYRFHLAEVFRYEEHLLDEAGERLLSLANRVLEASGESYSSLTVSDFVHPWVNLPSGARVQITPAGYRALLARHGDQADRRKAFETHYGLYSSHRNACAALYSGVCQSGVFLARARGFDSAIERVLAHDAVPLEVVEQLIATTREGIETLRRYHRLRKERLGLAVYDLYDSAQPLADIDPVYPYDEAVELVIASAEPLGSEYVSRLRRAVESRWIDVYEGDGKRGGAYAAYVHGLHPYVLLNHNDTLAAVFTLAHELGHAMHSVYTSERQPFVYSRSSMFVAEVASTLPEALLMDHLVRRAEDPATRVLLLQRAIDSAVGTFFAQVMFADFELRAHREVESERPLTADSLCDLYGRVLRDYPGDAVAANPLYRLTWARIPHFFKSPFYVYQYATSYAASALLSETILRGEGEERRAAVERHLELLAAGASDQPIRLLQRAGVDLSGPEPVAAVIARTDRLVTLLEEELAAL